MTTLPASWLRTANSEQAKQTGGMIALLPRLHDAEVLAVPGGEPVDDLHLTLVYFGEDVTDISGVELVEICDYLSTVYSPIDANVMGHAAFNPTGPEPCVVYLVGDAPELAALQASLKRSAEMRYGDAMAKQHSPFIPHLTAAYGAAPLCYTGPVTFDRLLLSWAGSKLVFDL